jgi:hypothetical protein
MATTMSFTLMFSISSHIYAWHENLGIDNNKAAELYQTKPNDPAIVQWKNALQSAINDVNNCLDIKTVMLCDKSLLESVLNNCTTHPNELLACNDARFIQYPLLLKKAEEAFSTKISQYAESVIEKCFSTPNSNTTFEVASPSCDTELHNLHRDCQMASSPYNYCKDKRFIGYLGLAPNNATNSTVLLAPNNATNSTVLP